MESKRGGIELTDLAQSESKHGPTRRTSSGSKLERESKSSKPRDDDTDEESGLLASKRLKANEKRPLPKTPHQRETPREKMLRVRRSYIALYAAENAMSFLEFFQLYAVMWAIMFHVPWPAEWTEYSAWTLFANLDGSMYWFYHNYTEFLNHSIGTPDPHFNMWGETREYGLVYAGVWAIVALALIVLVIWIHATRQSFNSKKCWRTPWLRSALQWFFYVTYLPFAISLLRPFACSYSDFRGKIVMDHDTLQECWTFEFTSDGIHGIAVVVIGSIAAVLLLYIPVWSIIHGKEHVVFDGRERHEHFLQQKQTEYVLGINNDYTVDNLAYIASFKQPITNFRVFVFARKLAVALLYVFLRENVIAMLGIMWGLQLAWCMAFTAFPPFRVRGSNVVMLLLDYTFAILGLLSVLKASNTNSDAFVDSNFQFILIIVVGVGLLLALLMWLFDGSCLACNPVEYSVSDPDSQTDLWKAEILRVHRTLFSLNSKPLELINIEELRSELKSMSECFHAAKEEGHILRYTLLDCMEDVQATVDECESRAMFPNQKLADVVVPLRNELAHQSEVHALVPPKSRRWLRKLEALRVFRIGYRGPQSDSDDDFADWEVESGSHSIAALSELTQDALMPPVNVEQANTLKKQWRARIQRWKQEFYRNTGAKPNSDDMWEIDAWRKNYLLLKDATRA